MNDAAPLHLGLDTSTAWLALSLYSPVGNTVLANEVVRAEREHAALLLPLLQETLARAGREVGDITAIGAGTGPGSYTGLRVGLASAAGLAAGLGVPLSGVSSLEAAAFAALRPGETGWPAFDARRGNAYAARIRRTASGLAVLVPPRKISWEELRRLAGERGDTLLRDPAPSAVWTAARAAAGEAATALYL